MATGRVVKVGAAVAAVLIGGLVAWRIHVWRIGPPPRPACAYFDIDYSKALGTLQLAIERAQVRANEAAADAQADGAFERAQFFNTRAAHLATVWPLLSKLRAKSDSTMCGAPIYGFLTDDYDLPGLLTSVVDEWQRRREAEARDAWNVGLKELLQIFVPSVTSVLVVLLTILLQDWSAKRAKAREPLIRPP